MDYFLTLGFLFFIYSFLGWLNEVNLSLFQHHKFINRGFLIGPILPIYGCGGVIMTLTLTQFKDHPIAVFALAVVVCSILEYVTSYIMEKLFNNRWWDYSDMKFNLNGRICLECASAFGLGAILMIYLINPFIVPIIETIPLNIRAIIFICIVIGMIFDIFISFGVIINLKNISNNVKSDSTEIISKKVKEILLTKNVIYKRLKDAFPDMQIKNAQAILKEKLEKQRIKLEKQKEKFLKKQQEFKDEIKKLSQKKTTKK